MTKQYCEKIFSTQRMSKYFLKYPDNEQKAIAHYKQNIIVSESFYPILSVFEVAFRNSINRELVEFFNTTDWYLHIESTTGLRNLKKEINIAKRQIVNRDETITSDKVIAELTLGFWVKLLNAEYERILWKPLRKAFPFMQKSIRQRNNVSAPINKIRNFRNRIFHHEPISWNLEELNKTHQDIITVMGWINKDLPNFIVEIDKVDTAISNTKEVLK